MNTTIPSQQNAQQPKRGLRQALLALTLGATMVGGAALARIPASAQHAPAAGSAARGALAVKAYGNCPTTTVLCP